MIQIPAFSRTLAMFPLIILFFSCTGDFEDINTNPSLITEDAMKPDMLFTAVQKNTIFDVQSSGIITEWAGYYDNPATNSMVNRNWADPFMASYRNDVLNISEAIRLTDDEPLSENQNAMARIWKVWIFHQLTDQYGDIPYFESSLAVEEAVDAPVYDTQQAIYADMLNELKESAALLSDDPEMFSFGAADLLYNGDIEKWRRFANSLRLRLAMRIRFADEPLSREHVSAVINGPLIETNEHNALLETEGENAANVNNRNPFFNRYISNTVPLYGSFTTSETLLSKNDPRLEIYLSPAPEPMNGDLYRGRPLAVDLEMEGDWAESAYYAEEHVSRLGEHFIHASYKIMVMSAAEVSFLRAEAALAGLTSEDKETLYRNGIRLSLEYYDIDANEINDYLATDEGSLNGSQEEQLEKIIVQKWIANYYQANESWAEYRRTGYPLIWIGKQIGDTQETIPRRLTYPDDEYFKNEANLRQAISRLENGDSYLSKVWWDAKPGLPLEHPRQGMFPPNGN